MLHPQKPMHPLGLELAATRLPCSTLLFLLLFRHTPCSSSTVYTDKPALGVPRQRLPLIPSFDLPRTGDVCVLTGHEASEPQPVYLGTSIHVCWQDQARGQLVPPFPPVCNQQSRSSMSSRPWAGKRGAEATRAQSFGVTAPTQCSYFNPCTEDASSDTVPVPKLSASLHWSSADCA